MIVAALIFALIPLVGMQLFLVVPVIGLALSAGAPPDYVADAKPVDRRPRNLVLGIVALICVAVVVLQPQLTPWLLALFGLDAAGLAVALIGVAALALPLAMADSATPITLRFAAYLGLLVQQGRFPPAGQHSRSHAIPSSSSGFLLLGVLALFLWHAKSQETAP